MPTSLKLKFIIVQICQGTLTNKGPFLQEVNRSSEFWCSPKFFAETSEVNF